MPVGEESVLVCVSAAHRGPAWRAGEEALEQVKSRVEVWKREVFANGRESVGRDGEAGTTVPEGAEEDADGEVGVWRANENAVDDGRVTGRMLARASAAEGHENGEEDDDDTKEEHDEQHTYAGDEGERRRIAEESRREMEMEMEKGWGGA